MAHGGLRLSTTQNISSRWFPRATPYVTPPCIDERDIVQIVTHLATGIANDMQRRDVRSARRQRHQATPTASPRRSPHRRGSPERRAVAATLYHAGNTGVGDRRANT